MIHNIHVNMDDFSLYVRNVGRIYLKDGEVFVEPYIVDESQADPAEMMVQADEVLEQTVRDAASTRDTRDLGGIDFDARKMNFQIKRNEKGIPLPVFLQPIKDMNINGFFPVIISITPALNLSAQILGTPIHGY